MEWVEIVGKLGFPVAVAIFLLVQSRKDRQEMNEDKKRLEARFSGLEEFCRKGLVDSLHSSTEVITKNTEVIKNNVQTMNETKKVLEECKLYLANKN